MEEIRLDIQQSLEKGIDYLKQHQLHNGEFISYFAPDEDMKEWCAPDYSITISILIGHSLLSLKEKLSVSIILHGIADFLEGQMQDHAQWNTFNKQHYLHEILPNDIDDTALASSFLKNMGRSFPSNKALILSNKNNKGVFYTWFSPRLSLKINKFFWLNSLRVLKNPLKSFALWLKYDARASDVDLVVNANILYFLGQSEATSFAIRYIVETIINQREKASDKWYHSPFVIYYSLSKLYHIGIKELEPIKEIIVKNTFSKKNFDGSFGSSAMETALSICVLINFGIKPVIFEQSVDYLIQSQHTQGYWKRKAFFWSSRKKEYCWGSEALTTAICLEAIFRFYKMANVNDE